MTAVRSLVFYLGYVVWSAFWSSLSVLVGWCLPLRSRYNFIIGGWTRPALGWLAFTCGIRWRVSGQEHIPSEPCIFLVKHQSNWETLWTQTLVAPQTTLIKRELLRIPLWGWAFALVKPIAIDRSNPRSALRQLIEQGKDRLARGMFVTLFPEGTRMAPGAAGKFYRGGAALAAATGLPVVVIAHNAGHCWPARRFIKYPGTIDVEISRPFPTEGKTSREINTLCEDWLERAMARLDV
ncbi:MAG: lysophospholipid acyltransferase family protein [Gammaproteobacteria bacterium]|nr:lysophospholipid acyltransferase family protein [Gammaproteobacteria bacterium]